MNKKGFTTIEIIVSISLVSIILIPLLVSLVKLREDYSKVNDDSDVRILGSSIVRTINNDIKQNGGIKSITCPQETMCTITLNNDETRQLTLRENEETQNLDITSPDVTKLQKTIKRTTLEYKNTTTNKKIMTKTLSSETLKTTYNDSNKERTIENTDNYHITHLTFKSNTYTVPKKENTTQKLYTITIHMSDTKYNINVYGLS